MNARFQDDMSQERYRPSETLTLILKNFFSRAVRNMNAATLKILDEYLTRFLQLGQTSLRLIGVSGVGIFFYHLP
jgi:hypothetical protein